MFPEIQVTPKDLGHAWVNVVGLVRLHPAISIAIVALVILFVGYSIYNDVRTVIVDAFDPRHRPIFLIFSVVMIGGTVLVSYWLSQNGNKLLGEGLTPKLSGPEVVVQDVGILRWSVPRMLKQDSHVVYDVQASTKPDFNELYRHFRTSQPSILIPPGYNRRLFWRVRADLPTGQTVFGERVKPIGEWSNVVETQNYTTIYERVLKTGRLRVLLGRANYTGIYGFFEGNLYRGVEPVLSCMVADDLSKATGRQITIDNGYADFTDLAEKVRSGEYDMALDSITVSPKREKDWGVRFSEPYGESGMSIVSNEVLPANEPLSRALAGATLATQKGVTGEQCADALNRSAHAAGRAPLKIARLDSLNDAFQQLGAGTIDAFIADTSYVEAWSEGKRHAVRAIQPSDFVPAVRASTPTTCWHQTYGIIVRKGDARLLDSVNATITRLTSNGTLEAMKALAGKQLWESLNSSTVPKARPARTSKEYCRTVIGEVDTYMRNTKKAPQTASAGP